MDLKKYFAQKKEAIDRLLDNLLPGEKEFPPRLHQAMRHCLFSGGKRIRPILALAAAEAVGGDPDEILQEACSLELIHTYTLVHDDLPCMDNDDYRRGTPSTHKLYGEAIAVLAGDALLTEAFKLLCLGLKKRSCTSEQIVEIIEIISNAAGSRGVIGGQSVDLESEGKMIKGSLLEYIHTHKTGCLITASVIIGGKLCGGSQNEILCLSRYGHAIGLAFQITDDILDVEGSTEELGKKTGSDKKKSKATFPLIFGMEKAKKRQIALYHKAMDALKPFNSRADCLREIGRYIIERQI